MTVTELTPPEFQRRAKLLKMVLLDVDGVLTDGTIILTGSGDDIKHFNVQDGMGVTLARAAGLKVGILTGRTSQAVQRRAEELKMDEVIQGYFHKNQALDALLDKLGLSCEEIAYIGDDILDLPVMRRIGLPIAVANARPEVKAASAYVTAESGGARGGAGGHRLAAGNEGSKRRNLCPVRRRRRRRQPTDDRLAAVSNERRHALGGNSRADDWRV